ncbi:hypothetical protein [Paenibacillus humicola]|uniref:hypothetical protein n=1 Tax=Paenibacillus humicola TaxID=3110540 RepID=UPI00237B4DDC|nr:hypothetical protein [Paenibacillus humicola]
MKRRYLFAIVVFLVLLCGGAGYHFFFTHDKELTLLEAYKLGNEEALAWDKNAKLMLITSVDELDKKTTTLGSNGKRSIWNMMFGSKEKKSVLILNIKNGKIVINKTVLENFKDSELISPGELLLDSPYMVDQAKKNNLKPGETWPKGYHFTVKKDEQGVHFAVVGQDENHKLTKLYFDPKTGELVGTERTQ